MSTASDRQGPRSWTTLLTWTTLAWFGLSLAMTVQEASIVDPAAVWLQVWFLTATRWVPGLLLTLGIFALTRAAPLGGPHWKEHLGLHVGAAVGLMVLGVFMQQGLLRTLQPAYAARVSFLDGVQSVLREMGVLFLMLYAGLVGIYHAVDTHLLNGPDTPAAEPSPHDSEPGKMRDRLVVRSGDTLIPVAVDNLDWIEAADTYVRLHLRNEDALLYRSSMNALADRLPDPTFLRIHRSTIVRLDAIDRLETPASAGRYAVVLRDGTRRRVSESYREPLLDTIGASEE